MNNLNYNNNDMFSYLRGNDLKELIFETQKVMIEYRKSLGIPDYFTFGVEIEYENIANYKVRKIFNDNTFLHDWDLDRDASLTNGGEIVSHILHDNENDWNELLLICKKLKKLRADTSHNAGGHIHVGINSLQHNLNSWMNFLKLYTAYENVLFRFIYGDKICARKNIYKFARPIGKDLYHFLVNDHIHDFDELKDYLPNDTRYLALNFRNVSFDIDKCKNTLEFRAPNATCNEVIWQNNINAITKMINSSNSGLIDIDFLNYKLKHETSFFIKNYYLYNEIDLKGVLEFVDLVFDNNLDKLYFLRQYFKDFQENYGFKDAINAKKFYK